jgi:uncharacterized SAM-binding protein YcdF (DUF218 family)
MTAPPKAALILGAAVWPDGRPSPTLRRRTLHAAALWRGGEVAHLVGCGGLGFHAPTEAEAIRNLLLEEGVPPEAIFLEGRSRSTHENILFALPILRALGSPPVVLVTDLTHAPRARLIAWGLGLRATSSSPSLRGAHWRTTARQALRELPATAVALWRLRRGVRPRRSGS